MTIQIRHITAHTTGQWWVINTSPASGNPTIYTVLQGTQADADNLPGGGGVAGPYSTQAAADKVAAASPPSGSGTPWGQILGSLPGDVVGGLTGSESQATAPDPLAGLAAIGNFFSQLGQANTWIRVGEVLLGLLLLGVGVARMTHAVPAATKIAKTAGALL